MTPEVQKLTAEKINAALGIICAVADAIKELGEVPSGHLYANLCGHLSLGEYETIIGILENTGLIEVEPSHLIVWKGIDVNG